MLSFIHKLLDATMKSRAETLAPLLASHIKSNDCVLDVGSGTGHNVQALRNQIGNSNQDKTKFWQVDVVDISRVGEPPTIFDGQHFPMADNQFNVSLLVFVLQYPVDPVGLLKEANRVTDGKIVVIQSTYQNWFAKMVLLIREFFWGRLAFWFSRMVGYVGSVPCSLNPARYCDQQQIDSMFETAGLVTIERLPRPWSFIGLNRNVYVLRAKDANSHGV